MRYIKTAIVATALLTFTIPASAQVTPTTMEELEALPPQAPVTYNLLVTYIELLELCEDSGKRSACMNDPDMRTFNSASLQGSTWANAASRLRRFNNALGTQQRADLWTGWAEVREVEANAAADRLRVKYGRI
jgi:hypothetical protein